MSRSVQTKKTDTPRPLKRWMWGWKMLGFNLWREGAETVCTCTCSSIYLRLQSSSLNVSESSVTIPDVPHFPPAQLCKHQAHPCSHPPPYWQNFCSLPLTSQPLAQQIGNSTLADVTNLYKEYEHNRKVFFCCGAATQRGSWPPHSWGF